MNIFGLKIGKYRYGELLEELTSFIASPQASTSFQLHDSRTSTPSFTCPQGEGVVGRILFTPNPEICLKTLKDREFLDVLQKANYLTSDGIGLYLAYQINDYFGKKTGTHPGAPLSFWERALGSGMLPYFFFNIIFRKTYLYERYGDRICGSDITRDLVEFSQKNNVRIAILDPYRPEDIEKCKSQEVFSEKLQEVFPELLFDYYIYSQDNKEEVERIILHSEAKILFSTLGMKSQEVSIIETLKTCKNIQLGLGVGSSFDYFIGFQKRAPKIWRDIGLEWLYRIFTAPKKFQRLQRIWQAVVVFPLKIIFYIEKK